MRLLSPPRFRESAGNSLCRLRLEPGGSCYLGDVLSFPGGFSGTVLGFQPPMPTGAAFGECLCGALVEGLPENHIPPGEVHLHTMSPRRFNLIRLTPYRELQSGDASIYDHIRPGSAVPQVVLDYLRTSCVHLSSPGVHPHPFRPEVRIGGPTLYTDGIYCWNSRTWEYVLHYGLILPQDFIHHVQSPAGQEFLRLHKGKVRNCPPMV